MDFIRKLAITVTIVGAIVAGVLGWVKTPGIAKEARKKAEEAKGLVDRLAQTVEKYREVQEVRDEGQERTQGLIVEWIKEAKDK